MPYTIKTFTKQSLLAALCIAIYGCGAGSYDKNQQVTIRDKHTIAYSISAEKRLHPRLLLQGQINDFSISDSQKLVDDGRYLDVVRANNTIWEGPSTLEQKTNMRDMGLVLFASPVNNEFLEVNVGAGLRYLEGDLLLNTVAQQESISIINKSGLSINSFVKYKFSPALAFSASAATGHFDSDRGSRMANVDIHWTPIKHIQFDFGLFYYGYSNNLPERYASTSDYQLQYRRVSSTINEEPISSCTDDLTHRSCPQGNYDSGLQVETKGLKAGVTFAF